ncbi:metallophosphoesterase [Bacteroidota bacterium]
MKTSMKMIKSHLSPGLAKVAVLSLLITMTSCMDKENIHTFLKGPYLQNPLMDGMTIMWESEELESGEVRYGETEKLGESTGEYHKTKIHQVMLSGLKPQTIYYYQVVTGNRKSEIHSFSTAVEKDSPFSFIAYGDNKNGPFNHEKVANLALTKDPNFAIHNGDLVNRGGVYVQWEKLFFNPIRHLISHVPIYTVIGNHEDMSDNYFSFFCPPCDTLAYYSIDYGNAHVIILNTEEESMFDSPNQVKWLIDDLESNQDATWKFVVFHVPPFTSGGNYYSGSRVEVKDLLVPIFQKYGVDMVLSGHDHHYERSFPIGSKSDNSAITYIVCGNGGTPMRYNSPREWTLYSERVFGFTLINIDGSKMHFQSISIDDRVIDEFTLDKADPASVAAYKKDMLYYEDIENPNKEALKAYDEGDDLQDEDFFEEAIVLFKKAYKLDPTCIEAMGQEAVCLVELERYEEAIALGKKAVEKSPRFPDSYEAVIESYVALENYEEALAWCDRLFAVTSDSPDAFTMKADIYEEQGEMDMAIEAMHKALEMLLSEYELHFDLADYYAVTGDTLNALKYYASGLDWYMEEEQEDDYFRAEAIVKKGNLISD